MSEHHYKTNIAWTGNLGNGTSDYRSYERSHTITVDGKPTIPASSDPSFRGSNIRYNPEELLVASLSSCHMLWYLHLCSVVGIVVIEYTDEAKGIMIETSDGGGHFKEVTLYPRVIVSDESMIDEANALHQKANKMCFVANSCNFPVFHKPTCNTI
ncbi:OsmC family protein [Mucilaginibacter sp.]|uniref:OsmC family protein n=1 Tax=Mucilaginibacter sp. TaxID=1882438 RepID=UPI002604BE71|nr:OsmC family protein [Mucilaginibacter sp.]MDB4923682.1 peroxiredoxin [Mucilaginibacter sp.]